MLSKVLSAPPSHAPHTIAHRIADDLGVAIVDGALADGARILEEEIAQHYGVSRSPVREAIQLLERRGLVRTASRKGTHVVGQTLDLIADLFNMRAVLVGLAARYVARRREPEALAALQPLFDAICTAAERPAVTPLAFARLGADAGQGIVQQCGAPYLRQMLSDHAHLSGWGMIWRKRALDFTTPDRRRAYARQFTRLSGHIACGRDAEAEGLLRQMMFDSRDAVLQAIVAARGGAIDPVHCLRDPKGAVAETG